MFHKITAFFKNLFSSDEIDDNLRKKIEEDVDDDSLKTAASKVKRKLDKKLVKKRSGKEWANHIGNQVVEPLQISEPESLAEVTDTLLKALDSGLTVRAAGSGHSYSDVATTRDYFIKTHGLGQHADDSNPIAGQLKQDDLKPQFRKEEMRSKWKSMEGTPEIDVDTDLADILKVREIAENNTLLFETESGITIRNLNKVLTKNDLGLPNMGGYDGQTIIGAISTSTHGSGISLGPFPNMVKSLVLATTGKWDGKVISGNPSSDGVQYYRIEPTDGITDPAAYKANQSHYQYHGRDIQLIQDDDCFYSTVVSLGTMGVIYSLVIEVIQLYYLTETRLCNTLDKVFEQLRPNKEDPMGIPDILKRYRNYEILVHPYPMDGNKVIDMDLDNNPSTYYSDFMTLETKRNITHPPEEDDDRDEGDKPRNPITRILGKLEVSFDVIAALMNEFPKITPGIVTSAMKGLEDQNYVKKSFRIYNLGLDGDAGFANEIAFPLYDDDGNYTLKYLEKAVNIIHAVAQKARKRGLQYQTSPFSLRFVNRSPAHLSMMNRGLTAMIELDMVNGTEGGIETINRQQEALYSNSGIPHWGLEFDMLTGNHGLISEMYPNYDKWMQVYRQFNAKGTFNNKTTDRLGFSRTDYISKD